MKEHKLIIILTSAVIVAALVLAYSINQRSQLPQRQSFQQEMDQIEQQSTSDDPEEIEEDIMETEIDNIDKELQDIEQELDAAY